MKKYVSSHNIEDKMRNNIWILNHYASDMYYSKGERHYHIAKFLKQAGYNPTVFCCITKHGVAEKYFETKGLWEEKIEESSGVPYVFVQARTYGNNGIKRVMNMVDFYHNVKRTARQYTRSHEMPDSIFASSVHPLTLVAGIQLAKKYKTNCICEVRDLWPETIVAYGIASEKNIAVKLLYRLEKWIYTKADAIVFTMEGGKDYIIEKGWDTGHGGPVDINKVYYINNGVDLESFDFNKKNNIVHDSDLDDSSNFKIVYSGSIRKVNDIGILLDVAQIIDESGQKIKLLIYGDGDERAELEKEATERKLVSIKFKGAVKKHQVPYILSKADACLLHWKPTAITRFGMSMNKTFEYLAAGRPIVSNSIAGYDLINRNEIGIAKNFINAKEYADSIIDVATLTDTKHKKMCNRARGLAKQYDFKYLTSKLIEIIEEKNSNQTTRRMD